jgi:fermentation-respiration switch protein FrsA (DUF1100 family)
MERVTFQNKGNTVVGNLFTPAGFEQGTKYPAIVVTHPFGAVKEQVSTTCAELLAAQGFITLVFDASSSRNDACTGRRGSHAGAASSKQSRGGSPWLWSAAGTARSAHDLIEAGAVVCCREWAGCSRIAAHLPESRHRDIPRR